MLFNRTVCFMYLLPNYTIQSKCTCSLLYLSGYFKGNSLISENYALIYFESASYKYFFFAGKSNYTIAKREDYIIRTCCRKSGK